ncbi:MAG: helix-hairpin-helix domain-containing protein, partial [Ruthenibacterium sp.]
VDVTGKVLDTAVIFPIPEFKRVEEAKRVVKNLIKKHGVEIIAIGNGTASKETEIFAAEVLHEMDVPVQYMVVSEAGASVYSASKLAAEEFPEYDVNLRSAVSIARRLQDPLAELVKIDPKAVGVGQYQHDMPPAQMSAALDGVVEYCVNTVGVDLNTASAPLLSRVAGVSAATAKNIVKLREENGEFKSRKELLKVPKLGPKAFEQCAGFLRVPGAKNRLDTTAVHPESYAAADKLLKLCGFTAADIGTEAVSTLADKAKAVGMVKIAEEIGVGVPTLTDMIAEILRPGRDMRESLPKPLLRTDVMDMKDLTAGMQLTGTVRNVIDFGAFIDIGVHQDGLVHVSQICNRFIKHPAEVLKVGDVVTVWVLSVDVPKKRIALTMKQPKEQAAPAQQS